jgi:hypothetical protein
MWNVTHMACFKVMHQYLPTETEEDRETSQDSRLHVRVSIPGCTYYIEVSTATL